MPLWDIQYSPKSLLSAEEKRDLVQSITKLYLAVGLPAFYVNVRFTEHGEDSLYNGGNPYPNHMVIRIEHIARQFRDINHKRGFLQRVDEFLTPLLKPKNVLWEYAVTVMDNECWEINGMIPPSAGSDMEKHWVSLNQPLAEMPN